MLSLIAVHAGRRVGEELRGGAKIWNSAKPYDTTAARVEPVSSVVGVRPSIIVVGLWPKPHDQVNNSPTIQKNQKWLGN